MSRIRPLSGFPELTPQGRVVEQAVLDRLRQTFELHGFASIETRAVEPLERLAKQGEIDKEVYAVSRLHAEPGSSAELGLHFDLTVPLARYVLEHAHALAFPFRRYQIQKVWRGERPQEGRYREFTQADIDIVNVDRLAPHHDIELPLVTLEALERLHVDLGLPPVLMRVNNRLLAQGFYLGLEIADPPAVLRQVDKLDKIGPDRVVDLLVGDVGVSETQARACVRLAEISAADGSFGDAVRRLGVEHPQLDEGIALLTDLVTTAARHVPGRLVADLKIARGLDYYTGTVYETELVGFASMGSISSGGRYDALASDGRTTYPGVGLSIGVTRLLAPLIGAGRLTASRPVPTVVLVAVDAEETRPEAIAVAELLRGRGIACEVAPAADKFGKQIRYADRRGIPFVWFGSPDGGRGEGPAQRRPAAGRPPGVAPAGGGPAAAGALEPVTEVVAAAEVLHRRLATQRLLADRLDSPAAVVGLLAGVQSQEFGHALWSLGMRSGGTFADAQAAFDRGEFVRTHVLRPTWHFARPEDIGWLLEVTAPRVHQLNGTMYRKLGLDPAALDRAAERDRRRADRRGGAHPGRARPAAGHQRPDAGLPGDERRAGGADRQRAVARRPAHLRPDGRAGPGRAPAHR